MNTSGAIFFLVDNFFSLFLIVILLRVILQYSGAPYSNPICQFLMTITNFGFKPLRKIIPGFGGIDCAGLVFAYLVAVVNIIVISYIKYSTLPGLFSVAFTAIFILIGTLLSILFWSIIISVILSFISPHGGYNPVSQIVYLITEPLLRPIRKALPPISGFDLSPLVACLGISFIRILFGV